MLFGWHINPRTHPPPTPPPPLPADAVRRGGLSVRLRRPRPPYPPPSGGGNVGYWNERFASFATRFHFAISARMCAPNCSGVLPTISEPSAVRRCVASGERTASTAAVGIFCTIDGGTRAPVMIPYHCVTSKPGSVSATVGSSIGGERVPPSIVQKIS